MVSICSSGVNPAATEADSQQPFLAVVKIISLHAFDSSGDRRAWPCRSYAAMAKERGEEEEGKRRMKEKENKKERERKRERREGSGEEERLSRVVDHRCLELKNNLVRLQVLGKRRAEGRQLTGLGSSPTTSLSYSPGNRPYSLRHSRNTNYIVSYVQ